MRFKQNYNLVSNPSIPPKNCEYCFTSHLSPVDNLSFKNFGHWPLPTSRLHTYFQKSGCIYVPFFRIHMLLFSGCICPIFFDANVPFFRMHICPFFVTLSEDGWAWVNTASIQTLRSIIDQFLTYHMAHTQNIT